MNINNATNSAISHAQTKAQAPSEKAENGFVARRTAPRSSVDQVNVSNKAKVGSQLDALSTKDKAEIKNFMQGMDKKGVNAKQHMDNAPQSIKNIAKKLNMDTKDVVAAVPAEFSGAQKAGRTGSKGISAYNAVAAQSKPMTVSHPATQNANKTLAPKVAAA